MSGPDNDLDRAEWLCGPELPLCEDCQRPTAHETAYGESVCVPCQLQRWIEECARVAKGDADERA